MSDYLVRVASLKDFAGGKLHVVDLDGREVLLCKDGEEIFAVDNLCSHAAEKLFLGKLKGGKILCPLHGAAFDIRTGEALSKPASKPLATFEVLVDGDDILLGPGPG